MAASLDFFTKIRFSFVFVRSVHFFCRWLLSRACFFLFFSVSSDVESYLMWITPVPFPSVFFICQKTCKNTPVFLNSWKSTMDSAWAIYNCLLVTFPFLSLHYANKSSSSSLPGYSNWWQCTNAVFLYNWYFKWDFSHQIRSKVIPVRKWNTFTYRP